MTASDALVTVAEFAAEQRISEDTAYFWRSKGLGPVSSKRGRRVVYRRSDIDAWVAATEELTTRGGQVAS